jgi:hypothetical protein
MIRITPSLSQRNLKSLLAIGLIAASAAIAPALTAEQRVTAAYVKEHSKEFSVTVVEGKNGLLSFTVIRKLDQPMYLVAHLSVSHAGRLVAESDTPVFGRKNENTFHFSLSREDVAESKFVLGESAFGKSGEELVPEPGTTDYQLSLQDFVPPRTGRPAAPERE